jgi:hypothetical protein
MMRYLRYAVMAIAIAIAAACACAQQASTKDERPNQIAGNRCIAKGGIGIINVDLYVSLNAAKNELILKGGQRWSGERVGTPELVIVFGDRVWHQKDIPRNFDLSRAIVVSFETDSVKFAQLDSMAGGYYQRPAHTQN